MFITVLHLYAFYIKGKRYFARAKKRKTNVIVFQSYLSRDGFEGGRRREAIKVEKYSVCFPVYP